MGRPSTFGPYLVICERGYNERGIWAPSTKLKNELHKHGDTHTGTVWPQRIVRCSQHRPREEGKVSWNHSNHNSSIFTNIDLFIVGWLRGPWPMSLACPAFKFCGFLWFSSPWISWVSSTCPFLMISGHCSRTRCIFLKLMAHLVFFPWWVGYQLLIVLLWVRVFYGLRAREASVWMARKRNSKHCYSTGVRHLHEKIGGYWNWISRRRNPGFNSYTDYLMIFHLSKTGSWYGDSKPEET